MKFINYLLKHNFGQITIALLIFGGLTIVSIYNPELHKSIAWAEAIAGFGTLFFAAFIWFNEISKRWKDELPKKMNVHFQLDGRDVMACYNVFLFNESDARAWSQQIGFQMAGNEHLKIEPYFKFTNQGVVTLKDATKINQYEMIFYLKEVPSKLKAKLGYENETPLGKQSLEWFQKQNTDGTYYIESLEVPSNQKMG